MRRNRITYWLARRILPRKPKYASMQDWVTWEKESKELHPYRYWFAEVFLDACQNTINWLPDKVRNMRRFYNNVFVSKTHTLTSNLEPGLWYDLDTRILNCLFDELANFVEVELANFHLACDEKAREKYKPSFWRQFGIFEYRNADAGLDYLDWEMTLTNVDELSEDKKNAAKPTNQAIAAKEICELYRWWKITRPNRPDPYQVSGYNDLIPDNVPLSELPRDKESKKLWSKALKQLIKIENNYEKEDEEMLIRLIKIRRSMWT